MKRLIIFGTLILVIIITIFYRQEKMTEFEIRRTVMNSDVKIHEVVTNSLEINNPIELKSLKDELKRIDFDLRETLKNTQRNQYIELHEDFLLKSYRVLEEKIRISENKLPTNSKFDELLYDFGKSFEELSKH